MKTTLPFCFILLYIFSAVRCLASERRDTLEAVFLDGAELTDDSIQNLTDCSKLHTLSISFCEEFTDRSLTYLRVSFSQGLVLFSCSAQQGFEIKCRSQKNLQTARKNSK